MSPPSLRVSIVVLRWAVSFCSCLLTETLLCYMKSPSVSCSPLPTSSISWTKTNQWPYWVHGFVPLSAFCLACLGNDPQRWYWIKRWVVLHWMYNYLMQETTLTQTFLIIICSFCVTLNYLHQHVLYSVEFKKAHIIHLKMSQYGNGAGEMAITNIIKHFCAIISQTWTTAAGQGWLPSRTRWYREGSQVRSTAGCWSSALNYLTTFWRSAAVKVVSFC